MKLKCLGFDAGDYEDCGEIANRIYYYNFQPSEEFLTMFPNFPKRKVNKLIIFNKGFTYMQVQNEDCRVQFNAKFVIKKAKLIEEPEEL